MLCSMYIKIKVRKKLDIPGYGWVLPSTTTGEFDVYSPVLSL